MNDMSLKAKIRNIAKERNISAQAVLQNYLMRRFLYRLSLSEYADKYVIKGGMLISSIVGIDQRATMDIDTTLRNLPLTETAIQESFEKICQISTDDGVTFEFLAIEPIRDDDEYGGYRVSFVAHFGKIDAPMSMDISTGDVITPGAKKHCFSDMFDTDDIFELWAYTIETVLAEKAETVLSRGTENTRPRDFYDIYMLAGYEYDWNLFKEAFTATSKHRESFDKIKEYDTIIDEISSSAEMNARWEGYTRQMPYAREISFEDTLAVLRRLMK